MSTGKLFGYWKHDMKVLNCYRDSYVSKCSDMICKLSVLTGLLFVLSIITFIVQTIGLIWYIFVMLFVLSLSTLILVVYHRSRLLSDFESKLDVKDVLAIREAMKCDYGHFNMHTKIYGDYIVTDSYKLDELNCGRCETINRRLDIDTSKIYVVSINDSLEFYVTSHVYHMIDYSDSEILVLNWKDWTSTHTKPDFYRLLGGLEKHRHIFEYTGTKQPMSLR